MADLTLTMGSTLTAFGWMLKPVQRDHSLRQDRPQIISTDPFAATPARCRILQKCVNIGVSLVRSGESTGKFCAPSDFLLYRLMAPTVLRYCLCNFLGQFVSCTAVYFTD